MDVTILADLRLVTDLQLDRARQDMARIAARDQAILDALADLETQVSCAFRLAVEDPYRQTGADAAFDLWAQRRRASLQMERARLRVARATAMGALRLAFGRAEALRLIADKAR